MKYKKTNPTKDKRKTKWIDFNKKRDSNVIQDYFIYLCLKLVGKRYNLTRERVRQIMEKNGYNPKEVRRAIKDYYEAIRIEKLYKTCSKCGKRFKLDIRRKFKRGNELCSPCYIKARHRFDNYRSQKEWARKNKEKVKQNNHEYYLAHKEKFKAYAKKYAKKYGQENKDKINTYQKKYYKKNKEKMRAKYKKYYKKNREKMCKKGREKYLKKKKERLIKHLGEI